MKNSLDSIQPIHLPDTIGWWPLAWGWWFMILLIALIVGLFFYRSTLIRLVNKINSNHYRKFSLKKLGGYKQQLSDTLDHRLFSCQVAELLKEICISKYGRTQSASLTAQQWINFLNSKTQTPLFDECSAELLITAPYCDSETFSHRFSETDVYKVASQVDRWIKEHQ